MVWCSRNYLECHVHIPPLHKRQWLHCYLQSAILTKQRTFAWVQCYCDQKHSISVCWHTFTPCSCSIDPLCFDFASQFSLCFSSQQGYLCWYFTFQQFHCSTVVSKTSSAIIIFPESSMIIMFGFGIDQTGLISWHNLMATSLFQGLWWNCGRILKAADPITPCNCHSLTVHTEWP